MLARNESAKGEFSFNAAFFFFFYERMSHSFTLSCLENDQSKLHWLQYIFMFQTLVIQFFYFDLYFLLSHFKYLWIVIRVSLCT